jgi:hypothetical protein
MADGQPIIATTEDELRTEALDRLKRKRDFRNHLAVFVLINASLWVIWAVTGAGFPWPVFPLVGWGIGVAFHAFDTFRKPFTEDDLRAEMQRLRQRQ